MSEHDTIDIDDDDDLADDDLVIRAKGAMDGTTTLADAAAQLRALAVYLDVLARDGWTLRVPVEDDYAYVVPPPGVEHNPEAWPVLRDGRVLTPELAAELAAEAERGYDVSRFTK